MSNVKKGKFAAFLPSSYISLIQKFDTSGSKRRAGGRERLFNF
jgi:hypothetical protein